MDTNVIKHVTISKLWGVKTISTDFYENVNIFIGENGTSKTTFLNLIEAVLLVDLRVFNNVDFKDIIIEIGGTIIQTVRVSKCERDGEFFIDYYFDNEEPISIPCGEILIQRSYRIPLKYRESYTIVKDKMKSMVNLSWLSINRDNTDYIEYERRDMDRFSNMVDFKLKELERNLILYQLQLESESNKLADRFKENVLSLMLYDENRDVFRTDEMTQYSNVDTKAMQTDLFKAFRALGVAKDKSSAIQSHVNKIKSVVDSITQKDSISIDEAFVLALISRTFSIIDISKTHEFQKNEIFSPLDKFVKCLHRFMPEKEFVLNKDNQGKIEIQLKGMSEDTIPIGLSSLSSGEKQLFILITESLLQKNIPHVFIADEPELSLHIGWQKLVIGEILKMNSNAQIIVATHSPEIAGSYPDNVTNMKKITSYE